MNEEEFLESLADLVAETDDLGDAELVAQLHYAAVLRHIRDDINPMTLTQTTMDWWLNMRIEELDNGKLRVSRRAG